MNREEIITAGEKLWKDINPNTKMDVPSIFFVKLEGVWKKWNESDSDLSFYDYCKVQIK